MAVSVRAALRGAFGFLPAAWRGAWAALILAAVCLALGAFVGHRDPSSSGVLHLLAAMASLAATVMLRGALFRMALKSVGMDRGAPGPGGLQWTATEWRLLGSGLLVAVLVGFAALMWLVILVAVFIALASANSGVVLADPRSFALPLDVRERLIIFVIGLGTLSFLPWIGLRLCLARVATVARQKVQVLSVWGLTRGRVWRLSAAFVAISLPTALAVIGAALAARAAGYEGWPVERAVVSTIFGLTAAFLYIPLEVGVTTYFLDHLSPEAPAPASP